MNWRFLFLILFAAGALYEGRAYLKTQRQNRLMQNAKAGSATGTELGVPLSCKDKKYCITVFVAPWCPVCKSSQGTFKMLADYLPQNRPDIGFGVVIGDGTPEQNKSEKEVMTPLEVQIDDNGSVLKARGVSSFPTWVVNDQNGKEIFRRAGGIQLSPGQVPLFISQFFGI
ncbi:MAG: TlpA family protein disulfide reductase [Pseudobdellovibrio sp.]